MELEAMNGQQDCLGKALEPSKPTWNTCHRPGRKNDWNWNWTKLGSRWNSEIGNFLGSVLLFSIEECIALADPVLQFQPCFSSRKHFALAKSLFPCSWRPSSHRIWFVMASNEGILSPSPSNPGAIVRAESLPGNSPSVLPSPSVEPEIPSPSPCRGGVSGKPSVALGSSGVSGGGGSGMGMFQTKCSLPKCEKVFMRQPTKCRP